MKNIIIDAGHGGEDIGTKAFGLTEKDITLLISKYIYDQLKKQGYNVTLVRENDITILDDERVKKILNTHQNNENVILISNHIDSDEKPAQIIYALRNNNALPNQIYEKLSKTGIDIKEPYQLSLPNNEKEDYYYILRNTKNIEPIMIQYGNLKNQDFAITIEENYKKYAQAVADALITYLENNINKNYYTVEKEDTIPSIAQKLNLTVEKIKELNNLSSNFITLGQKLKIKEPLIDEINYVVKKGDYLYKLAQTYNTTIDKIKKINNLTSNNLSIGDTLKIPVESQIEDYTTYTVNNNDTLYNLSKNYNTTIDKIKEYNELSNNNIIIEQELIMPSTQIDTDQTKINYTAYTVKKGDNLYNLAKTYNVSIEDIMKFNNLTTNLLNIGQKLNIPVEEEQVFVYTVKKGDTLWSIARAYNTTINSIKQKNRLSNNSISINQQLII